MLKIIIFSKPIHSGKSSALLYWLNQQKKSSGILMPEVNGLKQFYDISKAKYFEAEIAEIKTCSSQTQTIGKYHFSNTSFIKANQIVIDAFQNEKSIIIIDEIGKLELREEGFFESLQSILQSSSPKKNLSLLLVVRDSLLDEVNQFFHIKEFKLIHSIDELNELLNYS